MKTLKRMVTQWRHRLWQYRGEQCLLDTFWPNDYRIGTMVWHAGSCYQITRYERAPGATSFSVWGKPAADAIDYCQPAPRAGRPTQTALAIDNAIPVYWQAIRKRHTEQSRGIYSSATILQWKERRHGRQGTPARRDVLRGAAPRAGQRRASAACRPYAAPKRTNGSDWRVAQVKGLPVTHTLQGREARYMRRTT
jgi:hypothetical protein